MKFNFLRHYFNIFIFTYFIILISKFIFLFYLQKNFQEFNLNDSSYAILWGYKFDFAASAAVALLATLFDFNRKLFSFSSAVLLTSVFLIQIGDILYFNESSRHIGYEITDTITDARSLFMTAYSQHTSITIVSLVLSILLFVFIFSLFSKVTPIKLDKYYILKKVLIIIITIFFIRGMEQRIPLNPWQSNQIGNNKLASLSLNSFYNIVYTLANKKKKLEKLNLTTVGQDTIIKSFNELYPTKETNVDLPLIQTKPNVVFLFLESWSAKYLNSYGFEKTTTPNYDKILQQSMRPTGMLANGHRTTEGIFSALTSYQNPLGKSIAKTQLQSLHYDSIIDTLNQNGYSSGFFQGSSKETSGTGSFANSLGFKHSFGKKDVTNRNYEENYWGIHDHDLYNFVFEKIDSTLKEPFVLGINGATTHDSKVPEGIDKINFNEDENINNQLNALHFSDDALGEFIEKMEEKYPNTIFVIFADHCGGGLTTAFENYLIPFAIYSKKLIQPKYYNTYLSQRDIAPTVFDLAIGNYKKQMPGFTGKSLVSDKKFFADYFHSGTLGWIENNKLLELNTITKDIECFNLINFTTQQTECTQEYSIMKNRALSFTNISQDLLFKGKTTEFNTYRGFNEK